MSREICYTPASELAVKIRNGSLSPVDVVDAFLDRIEEHNPTINAYVTVCDEAAREAAREAERAVESGDDLGPLHGVPVAIKDLTDVKGVKTTNGSRLFADNVADEDAIVVDRLKRAGAIVLGKTNTPEFGRKPMTTNLLHGPTGNPWDPSRTAGGSSGGSGAAVAAGLAPIAQGSDAAGSIRVPSSANGIFGLMPDFGRVPMGESRADAFVNTHPYTYIGPMARTVEDAALMLDVIAGPHPSDPFSLPERDGAYTSVTRRSLDGTSVAYSPDLGICEVDSEIAGIVEDAVDGFRTAGATVEDVGGVFEQSWTELHDAIEVLLQERYRGMYDNLKRDLDIDLLEHRDDVTEEVVSRIEKSLELTALDVRRAERVRTTGYDAVQELLREYDLLVTPTLGMAPFEKDTQPTEINDVPIDPLHGWAHTWPINLTGNPTASVPAGFTDDGLPVGMQVIGRRMADADVLAASAAFERVRPWSGVRPPL
jgi:Asp-tRNA(Asn)/Glu-tRNA(Gln) amidotransferase A subunit family amidase